MSDITAAQVRQGLGELEARTVQRFAALEENLKQIVRAPQGALGNMGNGLASCGPKAQTEIAEAFKTGCCVPDFLVIDIPVPSGVTGQAANAIVTDTSGPNIITEIGIFARISPTDDRAADFAKSLITIPPTVCPPNGLPACATPIGFSCPSDDTSNATSLLLPTYDVRGASIPLGSRNVRAICCGSTQCVASTRDADGNVSSFAASIPILVPDHPEALDGEIEFFTNNMAWQFAPVQLDFFDQPNGGWDISKQREGGLGMCGYLPCGVQFTASINVLRAPRFDLEVKVVLAGYRIVTCGNTCGI